MCGILGLLAPQIDRAALQAAAASLRHRGPDDQGIYLGEGIALAARRLSIIDLDGGHQPLGNESGSIWITYNGEIVNAPALRAELEAAGHRFRTHSDTEVIVHGYEQWGPSVVERLRGMFAFGLWDASHHRLLLARDRFGIKPLYYAKTGNCLAFASEIKAILALLPDFPRHADHEALYRLFELGFIPTPLTAFEGIAKLPAAHVMTIEDGRTELRRYWQLTYPPVGAPLVGAPAIEQFMHHLHDAVAAWRLSDVPVGSLLSGGIDSSTLAALLATLSEEPIHTFHIAFAAAGHDESAHAQAVAQAIGSHHHTIDFTPDAFDLLPHVVCHLEEPQCSATSVPIYLLYRACHEAGFKVILTGEGADELLGGYPWFDGDRRLRSLLALPRPLRALLAHAPLPISPAGRGVLAQGTQDPIQRFALWHQVAPPERIAALLHVRASLVGALSIHHQWRNQFTQHLAGRHPLDQFLWLEAQTRMIDFINFEVDRMSMASSVEARPPFLDHKLWEFCAQLPPHFKLRPEANKWLLRQGMKDKLPPAIVNRPKQGLASPHAAWWRAPRLPDWAEERLQPSALTATGYFNPATVAHLRHAHERGAADHSRLLMGVLTTQLWHHHFLF